MAQDQLRPRINSQRLADRAHRSPTAPTVMRGFRGLGPRSRKDKRAAVRAFRGHTAPAILWAILGSNQ
jgi:hypothetical protein